MSNDPRIPVERLVTDLERAGLRLWAEDGTLKFRAPAGFMTDERRAQLRARRDEILAHLANGRLPRVVPDQEHRHDPFPVTEVQSAYLLGRGSTFAYGGVACHGYGELHYPDLDPERMTRAWRALIARHDMLRAVIDIDGSQRVLPHVDDYHVAVHDLRGRERGEFDRGVAEVRAEMDHRVFRPDAWPLFEARVTRGDDEAVLHVSVDFLIADFVSIQIILDELHHLYHGNEQLPALEIGFRDYLQAERNWTASHREADRDYWLRRVDDLPPGPELPLTSRARQTDGRFRRLAATLEPELWEGLRKHAGQHDVSPSCAVLAAYAHVIAAWSRRPTFTLNVTLLNRLPLHPQVPAVVGDFTGVELLAVGQSGAETFDRWARAVQAQLWQDMDHRAFSGIEVMREITRRRGADAALFPVVFTSAIGLGEAGAPAAASHGRLGYGISQTPQVVIDCQNSERDGGLSTNWDVRDGVLPDGVAEDMFAAFEQLLRQLATDDQAWQRVPSSLLPQRQRRRREEVNATAAPLTRARLHDAVFAQARRTPDAPAVIHGTATLSYADLAARATGVAARLVESGCVPGDLVGVTLERGPGQVVAVLGALLASAVYVPVDTVQPAARRETILTGAGVRYVLTSRDLAAGPWPPGVVVVALEEVPPADPPREPGGARPEDLAYVIHTSGSTGTPKGVMITHEAALNTVLDINARFAVGERDRVLGLSQLGFDLSVYDIFGPLSVGGALVVPDAERRADPSHWADLVATHGVTVWNSVPAQLQMLSGYLGVAGTALPTLRLAMLSGDWIPVALPDQIRAQVPGLSVVSLGGATEASIWSIHYPVGAVGEDWASIPYGRPLANQTFHVLDPLLRPCPDWVTGELYIGGAGLARGYLHDPERTAERFIVHPVTGERLYHTGDLGRYLPDGDIEFLGREDQQVKIRGHRIELAEIETALQSHPDVAAAAVLVAGDQPLERTLVAFAQPAAATPPAGDVADLEAVAARAGDAALAGIDPDRYLEYAHRLDQVALPAMLDTFRRAGMFASPDDRHTAAEIVAATDAAPRHHRLLRRWLAALVAEGLLAVDGDRYRLAGAVRPDALDAAWAAVEAAAVPGEERLLDYFRASIRHLPALLRGDEDPLRLLFPEGRLDVSQQLYEEAVFNRWANQAAGAVVADLGARRRHPGPLRVLEVGAGGGGTTAAVLDALAGQDIDYLCTDLSPYFAGQSQARFADVPGVRFGLYDLDADPTEQGLAPNSFDLVVAGDVLHATADVDRVLERLRGLLAPGGWLVALEMTRDHYQIMTSLELLVRLDDATGDFTDDRAGTETVFLARDRWRDILDRAGADTSVCLPAEGTFVGRMGMCVLAARFKADRAPAHPRALTDHLRARLPEYMVPGTVEILDELPVTDNGKIDRRSLAGRLGRRHGGTRAGLPGAAPETELERHLVALWSEALGTPVGRDGNLFELGGDSLVAAQLAGRIIEELPPARTLFFDEVLRNLLELATVARLAQWLTTAAEAGEQPHETGQERPAELLVAVHAEGTGVPRIFLPDESGSLDGVAPLAAALRPAAPAWVFTGAGLELLPSVDNAAAAYAQAVVDADLAQVELLAHGPMAVLAVEVARNLTERGVLVEGLRLVAGHRPGPGVADDPATPVRDALARHEPAIYAGDITLVQPARDAEIEFWEDLCLGSLDVVDTDLPAERLRWSAEPAALAAALDPAR
ncbi:amino acid adenylation domain-containing protein [Micromonospora sp. NPDC047738]|uniref:amino acid adenylation domain-containing protein n=1 Tax=Micromonospora sp. NPDC047738 TaxID=3155741 RepID=UPI0033C638B0